MDKMGVDSAKKPVDKKSLLQKYDIPIEHLSFEYISQCTYAKELERIVVILRSGEEGCYPDLTKHAEERLGVIKPGSTVLRIVEPVVKSHMLEPENRIRLDNDLNEWMSEMKMREKDLEEGRAMQMKEPISQPPIRQISFDQHDKKAPPFHNEQKSKRIAACDYAEWDKYDADTELKRIDLRQEQKQAQAKRAQKILRDKEEKMKKASREATIDKLTLTGTELNIMAEKEREKGNEAFKAGDFEEALHFYSSSIAIDATINAYNNRAITNIKLQRYPEAVKDCSNVINMDCTNVKALLRRALALDHLEKRAQSLADYEAVLKLQPSNKIAIEALNKLREPCESKKIRMKIEEGPETNENTKPPSFDAKSKSADNARNGSNAPKSSEDRSKNLSEGQTSSKIIDSFVYEPFNATSSSQISSKVCLCEEAPSSSQHLSPRPHFRNVYCSKARENTVRSSKKQSIYTDNKIPWGKSSGVIIEEIPNESCERTKEKFESERNGTQKNKREAKKLMNFASGDNKFTMKSGVFIQELPNVGTNADEFNKSANLQNPFDRTENLLEKTSGVIIEEIPNESCEKPETNFGTEKLKSYQTIQNSKTDKKNSFFIEESATEEDLPKAEDKRDGKIDEDRCEISGVPSAPELLSSGVKVSSEDTLATASEEAPRKQNDKVQEEPNVEPLIFVNGQKNEVSEKSGSLVADNSKEDEQTEARTFGLIESPYEFLRLWHSIKNDDDSILRAKLLKALPPENIETVIGNKLDGGMLSAILICLENHFCSAENSALLYRFLLYLGKVKRFSIVKMFMDDKDKKVLESILSFLNGRLTANLISDLREIYDI